MRQAYRGYVQVLHSAAPAAAVWRALVEPEALCQWCADRAEVEPRAGGRYAVRARRLGPREAHIDACEPHRRLKLILERAADWPADGDEAIVEDFLIDSADGRTVLRLIGSGVPGGREWDEALRHLRAGWAVAFADLKRYLDRHDTGNDA
jgi:uncharacterized protein YndB with AHSA1/START domain